MTKPYWRQFDLVSLVLTLVITGAGLAMIYSAYEATRPVAAESLLDNTVVHQTVTAVVGLIAYVVLAVLDYRWLVSMYRWIYALVLGLLLTTVVIGQTHFGAQSWFTLFGFSVQPSELGKVLMILVMAQILDSSRHDMERPWPFFLSLALVAIPVVLIYLQPDFGTAVILAATWALMAFAAGTRWRHLLLVGGAGALAAPLVWLRMEPYMRNRILDFIFPGSDPSGRSYNITQALISIGSGGWWGKGYLQGTQSQLQFLRVRHTDYIFSVLAEEFGFIGSLLLLALFAWLILRIMRIASRSSDPSGRLIAYGVASMVFIQAFINLGMNVQILPVTGLTLPLVSYGGSSLVTIFMALGLVQSVAMHSANAESSLF